MTTTAVKDDTATGKAGKKDKKGADGAKKKSLFKSKKFIMIVVALLAVGGGAYEFLMPVAVVPPAAGDTVALDATTVNLAAGHYLKIGVSIVLVAGKAASAAFTLADAQAAQLVISEFANRTVASISANSARDTLQKQLKLAIQKAYPDPTCSAADLKIAATATTTATSASAVTTAAKGSATNKSTAANTPTAASTLLTCTQVFDVFITQFVTQ